MRKLNSKHKQAFLDYLSTDKTSNTYILGNFYKYGLKSKDVDFYVEVCFDDSSIECVLMRYFNDFVFFTTKTLSDSALNQIAVKIHSYPFRAISGNDFSMKQLSKLFENSNTRETILMTLTNIVGGIEDFNCIRKLDTDDFASLRRLLLKIDEFEDKYRLNPDNRIIRTLLNDLIYGYFSNDILISSVSITAISPHSCMLTDICVDKDYRGKGISRQIVGYVVNMLLSKGISNVNLYVDNPLAMNAYLKMGFVCSGKYLILTQKS